MHSVSRCDFPGILFLLRARPVGPANSHFSRAFHTVSANSMFAINKTTSNAPPVAVAQPLYQQLPSDALHFGGFVPVSAGTPVGGRVHDALGIDEVTASLLHATDTYTIMQRPSLTEGLCPACERSNIYDVYDAVTGMHLFIAKERSDCVPRYCCAPYHSLFLELKGAAGLNPMLSHMVDVDTLGTVLTLERPGCMLPKPCLCCVACSDPCKDGMYLHAGALPADASAGGIRTTNRCIALSRSLALSLLHSSSSAQSSQPSESRSSVVAERDSCQRPSVTY